jgi:hypothetical protein
MELISTLTGEDPGKDHSTHERTCLMTSEETSKEHDPENLALAHNHAQKADIQHWRRLAFLFVLHDLLSSLNACS